MKTILFLIAFLCLSLLRAPIPPPAAPSCSTDHCGGFILNAPHCCEGHYCQLDLQCPDCGGTCQKCASHCGGNILNAPTCCSGQYCQLDKKCPDCGGECVRCPVFCGGGNNVQCCEGLHCVYNTNANAPNGFGVCQ